MTLVAFALDGATAAHARVFDAASVNRLDTIRVVTGGTKQLPLYEQAEWTWPRACPALRTMVHDAMHVRRQLPGVVGRLRAVSPHLDARCLASARATNGPGMRMMLGAERAERNAQMWDDSVNKSIAACSHVDGRGRTTIDPNASST